MLQQHVVKRKSELSLRRLSLPLHRCWQRWILNSYFNLVAITRFWSLVWIIVHTSFPYSSIHFPFTLAEKKHHKTPQFNRTLKKTNTAWRVPRRSGSVLGRHNLLDGDFRICRNKRSVAVVTSKEWGVLRMIRQTHCIKQNHIIYSEYDTEREPI